MAALTDHKPEGFAVWPENFAIVEAFVSVATQWRTTPLVDGRVIWMGLDYTAVSAGLDRAAIVLNAAQWSGLQVMERIASAALNGFRG